MTEHINTDKEHALKLTQALIELGYEVCGHDDKLNTIWRPRDPRMTVRIVVHKANEPLIR